MSVASVTRARSLAWSSGQGGVLGKLCRREGRSGRAVAGGIRPYSQSQPSQAQLPLSLVTDHGVNTQTQKTAQKIGHTYQFTDYKQTFMTIKKYSQEPSRIQNMTRNISFFVSCFFSTYSFEKTFFYRDKIYMCRNVPTLEEIVLNKSTLFENNHPVISVEIVWRLISRFIPAQADAGCSVT